MSGDMPKVWWSPSELGWFRRDATGRAFVVYGDEVWDELPADAVELKPVSDAPAAPGDPGPDPQPVNRELLAKLRSGVTAVERPAPGESDDLLAAFEPQCTQACSEAHTHWPGCLLWISPHDPAEDEDLVAILDRYLAWWEVSQDGMGPWPTDPDGGELRIVMALRDVLTQTSHADVEALVRKKFTRGHDV